MVTIVFALAVANLGLGFALAVAFDRLPLFAFPQLPDRSGSGVEGLVDAESEPGESSGTPDDDWGQRLKSAGIDPESMIERLLWIAKLDTQDRRERLVELGRGSSIQTRRSRSLATCSKSWNHFKMCLIAGSRR